MTSQEIGEAYDLPLAGESAILKRLGKSGKHAQNIERDLHRKVGLKVTVLKKVLDSNLVIHILKYNCS